MNPPPPKGSILVTIGNIPLKIDRWLILLPPIFEELDKQ
jgi:hypothetical protein